MSKFIFDLPKNYKILTYDILASTNDEAKKLAEAGAEHGTIIFSKSQTKGRGRSGREWVSGVGNLFVSIIIRTNKNAEELSQAAFPVALAAREAIGKHISKTKKIELKWPNDILINGKKAGGILLESNIKPAKKTADWLVVGIGINVKMKPAVNDVETTCLFLEGMKKGAAEEVLQSFINSFHKHFPTWEKNGFKEIRTAWLKAAYGAKKNISVKTSTGKVTGKFETIDEKGFLVIKSDSGKKLTISTGDIFFG